MGTAVTGLGGIFTASQSVRASDCNAYGDSKKTTDTYVGYKDGSDNDRVEKEYVHTARVEVDGPMEMDRSNRVKYYVAVHNLAVTYIKESGEPQIDMPYQYTHIYHPDEGNDHGAEWDFPQAESEPQWITRFDTEQTDDYELEDLAFDVAYESFQTGKDLFEDTVGTPYRVAADSVEYIDKIHSLYDKYQKATNDRTKVKYDWTFTGDDARPRAHTMMMFEVSDIKEGVSLDHTVETWGYTDGGGTMEKLTFDFTLEGSGSC